MAVKTSNASLGTNSKVTFLYNLVPVATNDIDSIEVTVNDVLLSRRALGGTKTKHDIDMGDITIEVKTAKTGSDNARIAQKLLDRHRQGLETLYYDIQHDIMSRDGVGLESKTYTNCVLQFKTVSVSESGAEITESITATADDIIVNDLIPPKTLP